MLPADVRRGSRAGMAGSEAPPPVRPRVAAVVGLTGVPGGIYPKKPFSSPTSISVEPAR